MKSLFIFLSIFLTLSFFVESCKIDDNSTGSSSEATAQTPASPKGKITFSLNNSPAPSSAEGLNKEGSTPAYVFFSIEDESGNIIMEERILELSLENHTDPKVLSPGKYYLTKFWVLDASKNPILAAPMAGSSKEHLADKILPLVMEVTKDLSTSVLVEVMPTEGYTPADFGYSSFSFLEVSTLKFDLAISYFDSKKPGNIITSSWVSIYVGEELLFDAEVEAVATQLEIKNAGENYLIKIQKEGFIDYQGSYTRDEILNFDGNLLPINLKRLAKYPLDISFISGMGRVLVASTLTPCDENCSFVFIQGEEIDLVALPSEGFAFTGWNGGCSGIEACALVMDGPKSVQANFERITHTLSIKLQGRGSVSDSSMGIECSSDCDFSLEEGETVSFSINSDSNYRFDHWEGACSGSVCSLTMLESKTITAVFVKKT